MKGKNVILLYRFSYSLHCEMPHVTARHRLDHSFFCGIITAHSLDEMPAGVQLLSDKQLDGYRTLQWRLKVCFYRLRDRSAVNILNGSGKDLQYN